MPAGKLSRDSDKRSQDGWSRLGQLLAACRPRQRRRSSRRCDSTAVTAAAPVPPFASLTLSGADYQLLTALGSGTYGDVFLVHCAAATATSAPPPSFPPYLAVKRHTRRSAGRSDFLASQRLAQALESAPERHPLIVGLLGHVTSGLDRLTLMEFCQRGDLQRAVGRCNETAVAFVTLELAEALGHLHDRRACHLDVRPCNILLSRGGHCRLADFSLAAVRPPGRSELRVRFDCEQNDASSSESNSTRGSNWLPPEIHRDGRPSPAGNFTDWFSLGTLAADLADPAVAAHQLGEFRHFVSRLCCPRPDQRLGSQGDVVEVLSHGFVTGPAARLLSLAIDGGVAGLRDLIRGQRLRPPDQLLEMLPELPVAAAESQAELGCAGGLTRSDRRSCGVDAIVIDGAAGFE